MKDNTEGLSLQWDPIGQSGAHPTQAREVSS